MNRIVAALVYFGLLAGLGGIIAERNGYLDGLISVESQASVSEAPRIVHYRAVVAAGEASIPNFDNATLALANRLKRSGIEAAILTSDAELLNDWRWYATAWQIERSLSGATSEEGCLVFVTSHGSTEGLVMQVDYGQRYTLTPRRLAEILSTDCGERPTVAILSGCHTGTFLTDEMKAANRIILTAARRDRTSFGCSADYSFTYFDECLLEALGDTRAGAGTWRAIFARTKGCIERRERAQNIEPSLPQAWFGPAVGNLGIE